MKLLQYKNNDEFKLGVSTEQGVLKVEEAANQLNIDVPTTMQDLIEAGEEGKQSVKTLIEKSKDSSSLFINESEIEYGPAVGTPEKIVCVGLNYMPHIEESNMEIPSSPVLFSKFNNSLASHHQDITLPDVAKKYDYEAELVLVIGKTAENVKEEDALSYVYGYSVGNDLSARDLQLLSGQWLIGKTLNHFAPIGPHLVTKDAVDPSNLSITCKVNGEERQASNTKNMIFNIPTLISYISKYMTLQPGDIIFTGTPEGVVLGYPEEKQVWLKSGDEVEVLIEDVGVLKNKLV